LIDQAVKIINSVHKRLHASQAEEFQLLVKVFREHPESFWQRKCKSKTAWDVQKFMLAADNCELVPQADPNTASMGQRVMKITGLKQLQQASPNLYDPIAIDTAALQAMGWSNPEQFFVPPAARAAPPPQLQELQAKMANEKASTQAKMVEAHARDTESKAKAAETQAKVQQGAFAPKQDAGGGAGSQQVDTPVDQALAHAKLMDANTKAMEVGLKAKMAHTENQNRDQDREAKRQEAMLNLAKEVIMEPKDAAGAGKKAVKIAKQVDKGIK
jgi:hypothetical protein